MAESLRIQQLKNLAGSLPVANQKVADGLQAAQDLQLKGSIKAAPTGAGPAAASQLGAGRVQAGGQIALQQAAQTAKQTSQVGSMGLAQQRVEATQQLGTQQRQVSAQQREYQDRLAGLSNDLKDTLLDQQLEFKADERGRQFLNDRQLADWARLNARSEEEYQDYAQQITQASQRKIQMMEHAYKIMTQELTQQLQKGEMAQNNAQVMRLRQQQQALQKKLEEEKAKAANKTAIISGVLGAGGAVVGAVYGGPTGAAAGYQAGSGAGTIIASQT